MLMQFPSAATRGYSGLEAANSSDMILELLIESSPGLKSVVSAETVKDWLGGIAGRASTVNGVVKANRAMVR